MIPVEAILQSKKIKIARITTIPNAFVHIKKQIGLMESEFELTLISSPGDYYSELEKEGRFNQVNIEIFREINIKGDIIALFKLWAHFLFNRYDIVHSSTPKAGLLVSVASFFALVPIRVHTFTGQRWATIEGGKRTFLKFLDKVITSLNTVCYADSPSQVEFLVGESIASERNLKSMGKGSFGGLDFSQFDPDKYNPACIKKELGIKEDHFIFLYLGRINRDKGIRELINAFVKLRADISSVELLLVGPVEDEDYFKNDRGHDGVTWIDFTNDPGKFYSISDVFCLPSYREGFGTVVLEAAAFNLPTIGTKIPGLIDAISEGETGILVEPRREDQLHDVMKLLFEDREMARSLGVQACKRAKTDFSCERIFTLQKDVYQWLLK